MSIGVAQKTFGAADFVSEVSLRNKNALKLKSLGIKLDASEDIGTINAIDPMAYCLSLLSVQLANILC